jgi:hypothetical protein
VTFNPLNFLRVQKAIRSAISLIAGNTVTNVIWVHPNIPRPNRPYIALDLVGEESTGAFDDEMVPRLAPTSVTVEVLTAVEGKSYKVVVNSIHYEYVAENGDTTTTIATELTSLINDGEKNITAASVGAVITLTPIYTGAIVEVYGVPEASFDINEIGEIYVWDFDGDRSFTFSVDVFSDDAMVDTGAISIATKIRKGLELQSIHDALELNGVAILGKPSPIRDLSAVFSTAFESRAQFDFVINTFTFQSEAGKYIENIQFDFIEE